MIDMNKLIPQIWADTIKADIDRRLAIYHQLAVEEQERHEQRMANDPEYARAYELRRAQDEAWSYWDALYENQLPELEEDDEW